MFIVLDNSPSSLLVCSFLGKRKFMRGSDAMRCAIWYLLHNFRNVSIAEACNCTKIYTLLLQTLTHISHSMILIVDNDLAKVLPCLKEKSPQCFN